MQYEGYEGISDDRANIGPDWVILGWGGGLLHTYSHSLEVRDQADPYPKYPSQTL